MSNSPIAMSMRHVCLQEFSRVHRHDSELLHRSTVLGADNEREEMTDFMRLLRGLYPAQSYALFSEVQSATAYQGKQRADAVAVGLWPSRGLDVIGFEFKRSRSDWLRELKKPDKAEEIFQFCDRWYLVVDGFDIVKVGERPNTWGLLVAHDGKLSEAVEAPKLTPKPMAREFMASLMRSAQKDRDRAVERPRAEIEAEVRRELAKEHEDIMEKLTAQFKDRLEKDQESRAKIEEALGVSFDSWRFPPGVVGAAMKLMTDRHNGLHAELGKAKETLAELLKRIEEAENGLASWPTREQLEGGSGT